MYFLAFCVFIPLSVFACYLNKLSVYQLTRFEDWANDITPNIVYDVIAEEFEYRLRHHRFLSEIFITERDFIEFLRPLHNIIPVSKLRIPALLGEKEEINRELELVSNHIEEAIKNKKMDRDGLKLLYNSLFQHSFICHEYYEKNDDVRASLNNVIDDMSVKLQESFSPGISTKPHFTALNYLDFKDISLSNIKIEHSKLECMKDGNAINQPLEPYFYPAITRIITNGLRRQNNTKVLSMRNRTNLTDF